MRGVIIPFPRRWIDAYRRFWTQSRDRLTSYLTTMRNGDAKMHDLKIDAPAGSNELYMTRTFDAPRALVWKALSEPEHVIAWFGPHSHKNRALEFDFRVGGKWRIESTMPNGRIVFFGDFLDIVKPERITQTFSFDQLPPGAHSVDTVELIETDGKTIYRAKSVMPDVASRDAMIASGMETGVVEGFERLDRMLEDWKALA